MNAISVANVAIRQFDNLYSLNDLHRAAGGLEKNKPANWLRNQQTADLIAELEKAQIRAIQKKQKLGTFVSKELVVHYGMWISPAFSLKVIRAFLDTQEDVSGSPKLGTQTTIDERRGLVDAVKAFAIRRNLDFSTAFKMVHQRFGVEKIEQIAAPLLPSAVAYVHSLMLHDGISGEVLDRLPPTLPNLEPMLFHTLFCAEFIYYHDAAFRLFNRSLAAGISDHAKDAMRLIRATARHMGVNLPDHRYFDSFPWAGDAAEKQQYHRLCFDI
ncbi:hypothetical protein A7P95_00105 [Eikenella longinqua]|uniref:KilA-N domain-containing protein n=1 Tax=Eikenella longinqua TaxID=1795827 RepID=A0A1A9S1Q9_9NEIS|nr:KilA-N domain-containing protein [Eikenella longinqua]OAM31474.1 hypothetical protein A7P95_00105 [Eikenella longinqua]